jgi:hypothetical protein
LNTQGLGKLRNQSKKSTSSQKLKSQQVLLAGQDGYVYILVDFEVKANIPVFNI